MGPSGPRATGMTLGGGKGANTKTSDFLKALKSEGELREDTIGQRPTTTPVVVGGNSTTNKQQQS